MKEKTMTQLVEIYNELAKARGMDLVKKNTFNSKEKIITRIKELQVEKGPENPEPKKGNGKPKAEKTGKPSKINIFREALVEKGELTKEEALNLTGYDSKNLHVAISILKNPERTKHPLQVKYDRKNQKFTLEEEVNADA